MVISKRNCSLFFLNDYSNKTSNKICLIKDGNIQTFDLKDDRMVDRIARSAVEVGPLFASRMFEKIVNEMARREFNR